MSIPQLRLVSSDHLPPDLCAAQNAATWLAHKTEFLCSLMLPRPTADNSATRAVEVLEHIRTEYAECYAAIQAVAIELAAVRENPCRLGGIVAATAHELAIRFADDVVSAVWCATYPPGDPEAMSAVLNPSARNPQRLLDDFKNIKARFRSNATEWPDVNELFAVLQVESSRAASKRVAKGPQAGNAAKTLTIEEEQREQNRTKFAELLIAAKKKMKGDQLRLVEFVCEHGGKCSVADLVQYLHLSNEQLHGRLYLVNQKLKKKKWFISRNKDEDGNPCLIADQI